MILPLSSLILIVSSSSGCHQWWLWCNPCPYYGSVLLLFSGTQGAVEWWSDQVSNFLFPGLYKCCTVGLSREVEGSYVLSLCVPSEKSYSVGEEIAAQLYSSGPHLRKPPRFAKELQQFKIPSLVSDQYSLRKWPRRMKDRRNSGHLQFACWQ